MVAAGRAVPHEDGQVPRCRLHGSAEFKRGFLVVAIQGGVRHYLDQLHHAPIFMGQDVAVQYVLAGEVYKPGTHLEIAGNGDCASWAASRSAGCVFLDIGRTLVELCTD